MAAVLGVLSFDFFFLPPRWSFHLSTPDLVSLLLLLAIAVSIGHLADRLRQQAVSAKKEQVRAQAVAMLSRDFAGAFTVEQVSGIAVAGIAEAFGFVARVELDADAQAPEGWSALPMRAPRKVRGTLLVPVAVLGKEDREFLETLASLTGLAVERIHFVEVARDALLRMEGERLRNQILSTLSHDLRTPLTGILAGVGSVEEELPSGDERRAKLSGVASEARRMADLVENLLELSRLQSGGVALRRDWNSAVELLDAALRQRIAHLGGRQVDVDVQDTVPLVWCDGVLVERVLVNLLDNAVRHTPPETPLRLWAEPFDGAVRFGLDDGGPGFDDAKIDEETRRGRIGLSLCRSIAQTHGGRMLVERSPLGGARVALELPLDRTPPDPPDEEGIA
jgi:two-component system sensor histidine kinase KdpD